MNPTEQIKALAELDGWEVMNKCNEEGEDYHILSNALTNVLSNWGEGKLEEYTNHFPDYLTSYDAIIPLIQKQSEGIKELFIKRLFLLVHQYTATTWGWGEVIQLLCDATPAQLCEALLRATGKWKE